MRINPQTWNNQISLRVELIGCGEAISTTVPTTAKPVNCYFLTGFILNINGIILINNINGIKSKFSSIILNRELLLRFIYIF